MLSHASFLYDIEGKDVPDNVQDVTVSVKIIPLKAFKNQRSLKKVVLLEGVQIIEKGAFEGCSALTTFKFPAHGFEKIEGDAFYYCDLLKNITFPNGLREIGESAFHSCESLITVDIPNSVQKIAEYAFRDCLSLSFVKVSTSIEVISDFTFFRCRDLKTAILPEGLKEIGDFAFSCCPSLNIMEVPRSVTKIGDNCFKGCEKLLEKSSLEFDGDVKRLTQERFHGLPMHQLLYRQHYEKSSINNTNAHVLRELYSEDEEAFRRKDMFGLTAIDIFYASTNNKSTEKDINITTTATTTSLIERLIEIARKYELDRECKLEREDKLTQEKELAKSSRFSDERIHVETLVM